MRHESIVSRIVSAIFNTRIPIRENLYYDSFKGTLDFADDDLPNWRAVKAFSNAPPFPYNIPSGSQTPIIINFTDNTIKIGTAGPVDIGKVLTNYQNNPDINFDLVIDATNTKPIGSVGWITNKQWVNNSYASLVSITLQPDTDTGLPGGLTEDNINIIIKP